MFWLFLSVHTCSFISREIFIIFKKIFHEFFQHCLKFACSKFHVCWTCRKSVAFFHLQFASSTSIISMPLLLWIIELFHIFPKSPKLLKLDKYSLKYGKKYAKCTEFWIDFKCIANAFWMYDILNAFTISADFCLNCFNAFKKDS